VRHDVKHIGRDSAYVVGVDARAVGAPDYDLGVRNPNRAAPTDERSPAEIIAAIETLNAQANAALRNLKQLTT